MPQEFNSLFGFMQFLKQKLRPKAHYSLEGIATGGIIIRWIRHLQGAHPKCSPIVPTGVIVATAKAYRRCLGFASCGLPPSVS